MDNNNHVHSFNSFLVPSTCKENGYTLYKCDCGYEHKENFQPLSEHQYFLSEEVQPTCTENGSRHFRCAVCGEEVTQAIPALGHVWGNWNLQIFPTCEANGSQIRFCVRCGIREEGIIHAKGHKFTNRPSKGTTECLCQNCGQMVPVPPKGVKFKTFISRHKVALITSFASLLVAALVLATIFLFIPAYNKAKLMNMYEEYYDDAMECLDDGDYAEAYENLKNCKDYKDSKILLNKFQIKYKSRDIVYYNKDGSIKAHATEKFDNMGNQTLYLKTYEGDVEGKKTNRIDTIYEYDEFGNITYKHVRELNKGVLTETTRVYEYDFDSNNRPAHKTIYTSEGEVISSVAYEYDANGFIKCAYYYNSADKLYQLSEYQRDDNGNFLSVLKYDKNDVITYKRESHYDENGNDVKSIYYTLKDDELVLDYSWENLYNEDGVKETANKYYADGRQKYNCRIENDENGYMTRYTVYDENEKLHSDETYGEAVIIFTP